MHHKRSRNHAAYRIPGPIAVVSTVDHHIRLDPPERALEPNLSSHEKHHEKCLEKCLEQGPDLIDLRLILEALIFLQS